MDFNLPAEIPIPHPQEEIKGARKVASGVHPHQGPSRPPLSHGMPSTVILYPVLNVGRGNDTKNVVDDP